MLSFKMLQVCSSRVVQYLHATINLTALIFIIVGLYAVFEDNDNTLYSIHSWAGFSVVILYCLQVSKIILFLYNFSTSTFWSNPTLTLYLLLVPKFSCLGWDIEVVAWLVSATLLKRLSESNMHHIVFQWACGFVAFIFPGLRMPTKTIYKQIHVFWGVVLFCGATLAIITGIMDFKP